MSRFIVKSTSVAAGGYTATHELRASSESPGIPNSKSATIVAATSGTHVLLAWTDQAAPHNAADWPTGGWGGSIDVNSAGADITYDICMSRTSSDGSTARAVGSLGGPTATILSSQSGTGIKSSTAVVLLSTNADATRAATDRVALSLLASNSNMMTNEGLSWNIEDADSWIENTNFNPVAATPSGTATGSYTFAGSPAGSRASRGTSTGSYTFAGSSAGEAPPNEGTASGAYNFTGSATGEAPPNHGSATGGFAFAGSAVGSAAHAGTGTGAYNFTGTSTGEHLSAGTSAGTFTFTGTATGEAPANAGSATGGYAFTGSVTGSSPHGGAATGGYAFAGTSAGNRSPEGASTGGYALAGSASGVAPIPGVKQGTAAGAYDFTGSASGAAPLAAPEGTASGTYTFTGSASGSEPAGGTASGATAWSGSASGSAAHEGSSTGTMAWVGTAAGAVPNMAQGTAAGGYDFEVTALGARPSEGSASSTTGWYGFASGSAPLVPDHEGSASGSFSFAMSTAGEVEHRGLVLGGLHFQGTAQGEGIDPTYPFQTPTYQRVLEAPLLTKRPRLALTESVSVVRINGTLQAHKSPPQELLEAAGVEGVDWFLGGREYQVSLETLQELQLAGF